MLSVDILVDMNRAVFNHDGLISKFNGNRLVQFNYTGTRLLFVIRVE